MQKCALITTLRVIGDTTDDKGRPSQPALRPEGTAPVVRSYVKINSCSEVQAKVLLHGPMSGAFAPIPPTGWPRDGGPFHEEIGIQGVKLHLNTLRPEPSKLLTPLKETLIQDSQRRLEAFFSVLDYKEKSSLPSLDEESQAHFDAVRPGQDLG